MKPYSKPCRCGHNKSHHDAKGHCNIGKQDEYGYLNMCNCTGYVWDKEKS